jgi:hypothetical protein
MLGFGALALVLALALGATGCALARAAARRRVALIQPDPELLRSTVISLSSWGIEVFPFDAAPLGASPVEARRRAIDVARRSSADVVSWISQEGGATVLWTYDAEATRVSSTEVANRPPFDGPAAAAVALSLKTMLRSSAVAPVDEHVPAPLLPASDHASALRMELAAGSRVVPGRLAEPRGAIALSFWPRPLAERMGFGLEASGGIGVQPTTAEGTLAFHDVSVAASMRSRIGLGTLFGIEPAVGVAAHWTTVEDTTSLHEAGPLRADRLDASLDGALTLDARFGPIRIGLRSVLEYLPRYQRYSVGSTPVLALGPLMGDLALRVSAGVF